MTIDVERILREGQERRAAEAKERREDFWAGHTDIPDLEFLTPECSVCGTPTLFESSAYECEGCQIVWPYNGYGHEARKWECDETMGSPNDW